MRRHPGPVPERASRVDLDSEQAAWHFESSDGAVKCTSFHNKLTGRTFALGEACEVALTFSAAPDRVQEPFRRVADFALRALETTGLDEAVFRLRSPSTSVEVALHYQLRGPTRRKWAEVTSRAGEDPLLLDVELDSFTTSATLAGGGQGQPLFLGDEVFAAVEHPAGENTIEAGRVKLAHFPGRRLEPGIPWTSRVALVSVAQAEQALDHFVSYLAENGRRKPKTVSVYTPFGINNQWGPCSTLDDEQTLDVLGVLEGWQRRGLRFDYFTLDTGWVDPNSDLTQFRPTCYPNGPDEVVQRVKALGMKFGLWFATSWAAESCWDYAPAWEGNGTPTMTWLNGYPARARFAGSFCMGSQPYVDLLRNAVVHLLDQLPGKAGRSAVPEPEEHPG